MTKTMKPNALRNATDTKALNPNEMAIIRRAGYKPQAYHKAVILKVTSEAMERACERIIKKVTGTRLWFVLKTSSEGRNQMVSMWQSGKPYSRQTTPLGVNRELKDTRKIKR